jgi:hypothetical protein
MICSDGQLSVAESTNVYCVARDEIIAGEKQVPETTTICEIGNYWF